MAQKSSVKLILSVVALLTSIIVSAACIFAWFSNQTENQTDGTVIEVVDQNDSPIVLSSIDGNSSLTRAAMLPGDIATIDLDVLRDISDFEVKINPEALTAAKFSEKFSNSNHLTIGNYRVGEAVDGGASTVYSDFNIDTALDNYNARPTVLVPLSAEQRTACKVAFLKRFTDNNSILNTLSVRIVKVDDEVVDVPLMRDNDKFIPGPEDVRTYLKDTVITIEFQYGGQNQYDEVEEEYYAFQPTIRYTVTDRLLPEINNAILPPGRYYAESLNCFSGQALQVILSGTDLGG